MDPSSFGRIKRATKNSSAGRTQGGSDARAACGSRGSGLLGRAVCAHQGGIGCSTRWLVDASRTRVRGHHSRRRLAEEGESHLGDRLRALDKHLLAPPLEAGVSPRVAPHRFRRHSWRPPAACAGQAPAGVDDRCPPPRLQPEAPSDRAAMLPTARVQWSTRAHPRSSLTCSRTSQLEDDSSDVSDGRRLLYTPPVPAAHAQLILGWLAEGPPA